MTIRSLNKLRAIDGKRIYSHGGHIIFHNGYYYLYGEDRRKNYYVSCYKSSDLKTWEFVSHPITTTTKEEVNKFNGKLGLLNKEGGKVNLERPKVLYNEVTKTFVMYIHYENGKDYLDAALCQATSKSPEGPFIYHGHKKPLGYMSRDLTVFKDDDKKAYVISAANDNADLHFYRLSDDYLDIDELINKQFIGKLREAPALFKKEGTYYLLTSYCTGWFPNQCKYSFTKDITGKWSTLRNIGNKTTSHSQPAFVLEKDNDFYYIGDRWGGLGWKTYEDFDYKKSYYVYSLLEISDNKVTFK